MIEQQRKRVERAISDMINEMYSSHLRKMQVGKRFRVYNSYSRTNLLILVRNAYVCI